MDINWLRGVMTVFWLIAFIGIVWWAWHPRSKSGFDEAANLPFVEDGGSKAATQLNKKEGQA